MAYVLSPGLQYQVDTAFSGFDAREEAQTLSFPNLSPETPVLMRPRVPVHTDVMLPLPSVVTPPRPPRMPPPSWQQQKCVAHWMMRMVDRDSCVSYYASELAAEQPHASTSAHDIEKMCDRAAKRFTVDDATRLCTSLGEAHAAFWDSWS